MVHGLPYSGGAVDITGIAVGVVAVFVLLTLFSLTAGVAIGVVLGRRAWEKKGDSPDRKLDFKEMNRTTEMGGTTEEEEGTKDHAYDVGDEECSIVGRAVVYQGLDEGTQVCDSVYTQLGGGTYQELDLQDKEEEQHYQRVDNGMEGDGGKK